MSIQLRNMDGVKKNDLYRIDPRKIQEDEGFNLRNYDDPEVAAHIEAFADSYASGRYVPPLIIRVTDDGRIVPVEGHCRRRGVMLAIERGADIPFVDCVQFKGNDQERVEIMLRSAEGMRLKPLEVAEGFLRLTRMGHDAESIASMMSGKVGAARVAQLLTLANANTDVKTLVRAGLVAADVAIDAVKKHGEQAGAFLREQVDKAKSIGKQSVTQSVVSGPKIPPKVVESTVSTFREAMSLLPADTRQELGKLRETADEAGTDAVVSVSASVMLKLLEAAEAMEAAQKQAEEKLKARQEKAAQAGSESE